MRRVIAMGAVLALSACRRAPADAPDAAYRAFVQAAAEGHSGKDEKLLAYFDAPTRATLQARAKAASQATGKKMPDDAAYQMLLGAADVPPLANVRVVHASGDAATLEVTTDGGAPAQVKMVREAGRWRIHLDALPGGNR